MHDRRDTGLQGALDRHRDGIRGTSCCTSLQYHCLFETSLAEGPAPGFTSVVLNSITCCCASSTIAPVLSCEAFDVILGRQHSSLPILFTRALVFLLMKDQNMCAPKMLSLPLTMNRGCQNSASLLYIFCEYSHLHAYNILHHDPCHMPKFICCQSPLYKGLLMSLDCPRTGT